MLQFRSFLITGLMVGAALLLPHNAFAEKKDSSEIPEKAAAGAKAAVVYKEAVKAQASVVSKKTVHQTVIKAAPLHAGAKKAVAKAQSTAAQVKGRTGQSLAKPQKAVIPPGLNKAAAEIVKSKAEPQAASENRQLPVSHAQNIEIETKVQPEKPIHKGNLQLKKPSVKISELEDTVSQPAKKEIPPVSQEELPKISQMLDQVQRAGSSGRDSNDRVTHGSSSIYGMDKWLEWDRYRESGLVQLFVSRHIFIQNQWMNAPPSPPPKKAPFITNVTR